MRLTIPATVAILAAVLTGCASTPRTILQGQDAMAITLSGTWRDDLTRYQEGTASVAQRRPPNTGIRTLAYVVRSNRFEGACSFRELRYLPGEVGYPWDEERVANAVAQFRNQVRGNFKFKDYFALGVAVPIDQQGTVQTTALSSERVQFNGYPGWQMRFKHSPDSEKSKGRFSITRTVVWQPVVYGAPLEHKFYIVAECSAWGLDTEVAAIEKETDEMLGSIQLRVHTPVFR